MVQVVRALLGAGGDYAASGAGLSIASVISVPASARCRDGLDTARRNRSACPPGDLLRAVGMELLSAVLVCPFGQRRWVYDGLVDHSVGAGVAAP